MTIQSPISLAKTPVCTSTGSWVCSGILGIPPERGRDFEIASRDRIYIRPSNPYAFVFDPRDRKIHGVRYHGNVSSASALRLKANVDEFWKTGRTRVTHWSRGHLPSGSGRCDIQQSNLNREPTCIEGKSPGGCHAVPKAQNIGATEQNRSDCAWGVDKPADTIRTPT